MILSELLSRLAKSELSNLSLVDEDTQDIRPASRAKVIGYVNEALLRLHSRFVLREDDVLVQMFEQITTYELKAQFAQSYAGDIDVPYRYIIDGTGPEKFKDDVIRVTGAFDSYGEELELNNQMAPTSLFTPRPKVLQVPVPMPGQVLSVVYQAKHPLLSATDLDEEVEIPEVLVGGLTAYVGYMAFNFLGGAENMGRATGFMQVYDKICMEMEEKDGMGTTTRSHSDAFEMKGWI
jgi:hypothetical protein